jgi:hypothetical protein
MSYSNNYSTGDIYGDVFTAKSYLDTIYDMNLDGSDSDRLKMVGREYLSIGQCSGQMFLTFKPIRVVLEQGNDEKFHPTASRLSADERNGDDYQLVEVVKNLNKFESSIKHKSNVFSVVV